MNTALRGGSAYLSSINARIANYRGTATDLGSLNARSNVNISKINDAIKQRSVNPNHSQHSQIIMKPDGAYLTGACIPIGTSVAPTSELFFMKVPQHVLDDATTHEPVLVARQILPIFEGECRYHAPCSCALNAISSVYQRCTNPLSAYAPSTIRRFTEFARVYARHVYRGQEKLGDSLTQIATEYLAQMPNLSVKAKLKRINAITELGECSAIGL